MAEKIGDSQERYLTDRHTFTISTDEPYSKTKLWLEIVVNNDIKSS